MVVYGRTYSPGLQLQCYAVQNNMSSLGAHDGVMVKRASLGYSYSVLRYIILCNDYVAHGGLRMRHTPPGPRSKGYTV